MQSRLQRLVAVLSLLFLLLPSSSVAQRAAQRPISLQEGLARELTSILAVPEFGTELNRARKQFPALAVTTQLFIAYTGFADRTRPARFDAGWQPPFPPIGPPHVDLCSFMPTTCRCRAGDRDACVSIASEGDDGPGLKLDLGAGLRLVPTCDQLRQQYRETVDRIIALLAQPTLTPAQMEELAQLQTELNALYESLVNRGCLA
jgi:hypothetical protein